MKRKIVLNWILCIMLIMHCFTACEDTSDVDVIRQGDSIMFGTYEQDNNIYNGRESIEWIILDVKVDKALILSKYALDCIPYNNVSESVTWETSSIRSWLNENFYSEAFDEEDKDYILESYVINNSNEEYDTDGGNDTIDKIFLLSIDEVDKYFDGVYAVNDSFCTPTDYAIGKGCYAGESDTDEDKGRIRCCWWLRSPCHNQKCVSYVNESGYYSGDGFPFSTFGCQLASSGFGDDSIIDDIKYCVRPALWVDIDLLE